MVGIAAVDPRTGERLAPVARETSAPETAGVVEAAAAAAGEFARRSRLTRAAMLDAIADGIDASAPTLIATAFRETGFSDQKLTGELARASYQFRFFATVVRDGAFLEAIIDHPSQTPAGMQPDLRRMLVPLGPVAVFGSSNFPFAFSVLGGDVASALAAGNPVVIKAHGSHPETSLRSYEVLVAALQATGMPRGLIGIVFGLQAGIDLVTDPRIKAVGFTGSLTGGKALMDAIATRDEPIPFYGEMSSLNPVIVTAAAAAARGLDIGSAYAASLSIGSGQLCTKPGFLLAPMGAAGDALVAAAAEALASVSAHVLLNETIHDSFGAGIAHLDSEEGITTIARGAQRPEPGYWVDAALFEVALADFTEAMAHEIFGPVSIVIRYESDVIEAARRLMHVLPPSLTVSLHVAEDDADPVHELTDLAVEHGGRIIFNGFPTGVSVSWAQTHAGPWPATNALHTSVGATAVRRFLRPVTYQDAPAEVLPEELRDEYELIARRIDGVLIGPNGNESVA